MGRRPRAAVLAVLLTVVAACALAAAGCGGDEDLTEGLNPEEILDEQSRGGRGSGHATMRTSR